MSFKDTDGIRHQVEVQAESVYEAATLALRAFRKSEWIEVIGPATRLDIEVLEPSVHHFLMVTQLTHWLDSGGKTPEEVSRKRRLKAMLNEARSKRAAS